MVHLAQGRVRPSFSIALSVMFSIFENFTLCDLDNFNVIIKNTFLDLNKVNILHTKSRVRIRAKVGFKLMTLDAKYNSMLMGVGINLVTLVNELKLPSF